ncbi:MAG: hypothetical protein M1343_08260 [Chloroflexi bacterium]|nr:hypothetical protein [Chloroflexota bacterium]
MKRKKVLLLDVDSRIPNLALMRISAYHRARGDVVSLHPSGKPDEVYVSCVFSKHRRKAEALRQIYPDAVIGGSGWDLSVALPSEIEAIRPDYDLYGIDYGIGYTSRGCIRRCNFCVVPHYHGASKCGEGTALLFSMGESANLQIV